MHTRPDPRITRITVHDVRFPTSLELDGSDAMNPDPDYSAAYVVLHTDAEVHGHGFTFTIGRGTDLVAAAARAIAEPLVGRPLSDFTRDMAAFWREITGDSQLRWLGPEKGVVHLATGAVINAVWDLWAKVEGKPVWKLLADMSPEQLVACIDFRYITDALTPDEALEILRRVQDGKADRETTLLERGYPAYTTGAGWLGYDDDKLRRLILAYQARGFTAFKLKVGRDIHDDRRRAAIAREAIGDDGQLMFDANQMWDVDEAIVRTQALLEFHPLWMEEPTSPDDILGHARIDRAIRASGTRVATGEHAQNRVTFKQLFQADAIGYCQIDAARVGGVNENLAIILMAAKFGVPIVPHAGGVGLCELVQHLSMWDYLAVTGSTEGRFIEYADHLHQHFIDPAVIDGGHYRAPRLPGYSAELLPDSLATYVYPDGVYWAASFEDVHATVR